MFTINQANNSGGGGGSGGDYPKDAEFDSIKAQTIDCDSIKAQTIYCDTITVNTDATLNSIKVNNDATLNSIKAQTIDCDTIKVNDDATFKVNDKSITFANHESRITTLEQSSTDLPLTFTSGYPEIVIDKRTLSVGGDNVYHELNINLDKDIYGDYVGDLLEFILPADFKITDKVIISKQEGWKFTCPVIDYNGKYTLKTVNDWNIPMIRFHSVEYPMELYTGDIEIHSIIPQPTLATDENINVKCHEIIADNALTLYRSPLPNLYEMKECGEIDNFYYGYWGYDSGSPEFEALLEVVYRMGDFCTKCKNTVVIVIDV